MFGKVISIEDNIVILENLSQEAQANYLNIHVVFPEDNRSVVGEIININTDVINILLVGEIRNNVFTSGVIKKPTFKSGARLIYKSELELILGRQDIASRNTLYLGKSNIYEGYNVSANLTDFFSNHFAIIGNTGSGKSCGVARILQNIFLHNSDGNPKNAHLVIFDVYGEYNKSLEVLNKIPDLGFKNFSSKTDMTEGELVNIPAYFLGVDDLALLLNATSSNQLAILEKTLKLVYIFKATDDVAKNYKNDIIASTLLEILTSGKTSTQIRDQVIAVLSRYNTETLNIDAQIVQPGYTRTIKQCLNIDQSGKINSLQFVIEYLEKFQKLDLSNLDLKHDLVYSLDDLYYALDFALISEGVLKSDRIYDDNNQLKTRLQQIINSDNKLFFKTDEYMTKAEYIRNLFKSIEGRNVQIVNMNLNYIDERFAKVLTKIYTKMFFDFATNLNERASYPIHLILEEAHRYVQNDTDIKILGYNIFDRIAKEGRKYGVLLGLITQRPSELSTTALSQCSNFITFRMFHPTDIEIISSISSNVDASVIEKLKSLVPGTAMVFGVSFKIPLLIKLDLPDPMPESTSVDIESRWFGA